MATYGVFEAKNKFSELLDRAERGEKIIITRRGKPIAKLVAEKNEAAAQARVKDALERLRKTRATLKAHSVSFSTKEILAARDESRR